MDVRIELKPGVIVHYYLSLSTKEDHDKMTREELQDMLAKQRALCGAYARNWCCQEDVVNCPACKSLLEEEE